MRVERRPDHDERWSRKPGREEFHPRRPMPRSAHLAKLILVDRPIAIHGTAGLKPSGLPIPPQVELIDPQTLIPGTGRWHRRSALPVAHCPSMFSDLRGPGVAVIETLTLNGAPFDRLATDLINALIALARAIATVRPPSVRDEICTVADRKPDPINLAVSWRALRVLLAVIWQDLNLKCALPSVTGRCAGRQRVTTSSETPCLLYAVTCSRTPAPIARLIWHRDTPDLAEHNTRLPATPALEATAFAPPALTAGVVLALGICVQT